MTVRPDKVQLSYEIAPVALVTDKRFMPQTRGACKAPLTDRSTSCGRPLLEHALLDTFIFGKNCRPLPEARA